MEMTLPETTPLPIEAPLRVIDLKQWVYCPRILYYYLCLPKVRPTTFRMEAGIDAGKEEESKEERRSLRAYGLKSGRREFNLRLQSDQLGLRGVADLVIWLDTTTGDPGEVIPIDYKLSDTPGDHFQMQLMAYGLLLEEQSGYTAKRGFLYEIPLHKAIEVRFTAALRQKTLAALEMMRHMLWTEAMPEPTPQRRKCLSCEFRRFCNDIS